MANRAGRLTSRQAAFVAEYLVDLNQTQAAIRAGYSPRSAKACAARMMTFANVAAAIAEAKAARAKMTGITQERVLRELEALAFSNHAHFAQDQETGRLVLAPGAPESAHAAVSSVKYKTTSYGGGDGPPTVVREVEFKLWDKPGPLKLAGRHADAKGFWDRVEVTGKDGGPVKTQQVTRDEAIEALRAVMPAALREQPSQETTASVTPPEMTEE